MARREIRAILGKKEITVIRAIKGIQGKRGKLVLIAPCKAHRA